MRRATTFSMHIYPLFAAFITVFPACAVTKPNTIIKEYEMLVTQEERKR